MTNNPIRDIIAEVVKKEGKKTSINIANASEFTKLLNEALGGELYRIIKDRRKKSIDWLTPTIIAIIIVAVHSGMTIPFYLLIAQEGYNQGAKNAITKHVFIQPDTQKILEEGIQQGRLLEHDRARFQAMNEGIKIGKILKCGACKAAPVKVKLNAFCED